MARMLLKASGEESPMSPNENDRTPTMARPAPGQAARVPHLVVLSGARVGSAYPLTKPEMIVGRDSSADIALAHPTVSRRHARVTVQADRVLVEDLDSNNGTYVGLDRINRPTALEDGEAVAFGSFTLFKLTYAEASEAATSDAGGAVAAVNAKGPVRARDFLIDVLKAEYAYARRHRAPLTLVFFRADAFATVGGVEALRDELLSAVVTTIESATRTEDLLTRSGEDELAVLVRGDGTSASAMAERVRARIEVQTGFPERSPAWQTVTAVVLPIQPASSGPSTAAANAGEILAAAETMARSAMRDIANRVVRLRPLIV